MLAAPAKLLQEDITTYLAQVPLPAAFFFPMHVSLFVDCLTFSCFTDGVTLKAGGFQL